MIAGDHERSLEIAGDHERSLRIGAGPTRAHSQHKYVADPSFTVKQHLIYPDFTVNESEHAAQIFLHQIDADVRRF